MAFKIIAQNYVDKVVSGGTYNPSTSEITFTNTNNDSFVVTGITSGSTTNPAGNTTEVQYNDGGAFGADAGFSRDPSTGSQSFFVTSEIGDKFFVQGQGDWTNTGILSEVVGQFYANLDINGGILTGNLVPLGLSGEGHAILIGDDATGDVSLINMRPDLASMTNDSVNSSGSVIVTDGLAALGLQDPTGLVYQHAVNITDAGISFFHLGGGYVFPTDAGTANQVLETDGAGQLSWVDKDIQSFQIAMSDETTALTTGTSVTSFMVPNDFVVTEVMMFVNTAPVGSALIVDVNLSGSTIFSTRPQIDAGSSTSQGSVVTPVLGTTSFSKWNILTLDIDQVGSGTAGAGLKIILNGYYV